MYQQIYSFYLLVIRYNIHFYTHFSANKNTESNTFEYLCQELTKMLLFDQASETTHSFISSLTKEHFNVKPF